MTLLQKLRSLVFGYPTADSAVGPISEVRNNLTNVRDINQDRVVEIEEDIQELETEQFYRQNEADQAAYFISNIDRAFPGFNIGGNDDA